MPAPKGNQFAKGNRGGGRASLYKPEYVEIARKKCFAGATNADLAMRFGVAESTLWHWTQERPEFAEAIKAGKDAFDHHVERALAQRACGYDYMAQQVISFKGDHRVVEYREHVPADVGAAIHWLAKRKPKEWGTKPRVEGVDDLIAALYDRVCGEVPRPPNWRRR